MRYVDVDLVDLLQETNQNPSDKNGVNRRSSLVCESTGVPYDPNKENATPIKKKGIGFERKCSFFIIKIPTTHANIFSKIQGSRRRCRWIVLGSFHSSRTVG